MKKKIHMGGGEAVEQNPIVNPWREASTAIRIVSQS